MHSTKYSLTKADILRGRTTYDRLLREGRRVRGRGVTLFFYLRPDGGSGRSYRYAL